jgi:glycine C-acetyltransferase
VQISAAHTREHLDRAVDAFSRVGGKLGLLADAARQTFDE